jgi:D-sedoheptulose 7-phosphate isomerase
MKHDLASGVGHSTADVERADSVATVVAHYVAELRSLLEVLDVDALDRLTQHFRTVRDAGRTVFIAGNGGSAATATHWVNDLSKAASRSGRTPFRCICLSDNVSWLTALANDEGYERVFTGQLENLATPGDLLVLISASGSSPNLIDAVRFARSRGLVTGALVGFDGGQLRDLVDACVWVETPKGAYGVVESMHSVMADMITTFLIGDRAGSDQ